MTTARIDLRAIELDTSIQCRATIDTAVVNEYAERMAAGDRFPPIDVYGTKTKCWIGDGWHRVLAQRERAAKSIAANLHPGGRVDALKAALGANSLHGLHRSNKDKRRCVEIALREFPKLSNVRIGKLCGVADTTVADHRPVNLGNTDVEKRLGADGKERPAKLAAKPQPIDEVHVHASRELCEALTAPAPSTPRDPSQTGSSVADIPDKEESELVSSRLAELKRHWKSATRADRRAFLQWINRKNQNQTRKEQA